MRRAHKGMSRTTKCEDLVQEVLSRIPAGTRRFTAEGFYRRGSVRLPKDQLLPDEKASVKQFTPKRNMLEPRQDAIAQRNLLNLRLESYRIKSDIKPIRFDSTWKPLNRKVSSNSGVVKLKVDYLPTKEQRRVAEKIEACRQKIAGK